MRINVGYWIVIVCRGCDNICYVSFVFIVISCIWWMIYVVIVCFCIYYVF